MSSVSLKPACFGKYNSHVDCGICAFGHQCKALKGSWVVDAVKEHPVNVTTKPECFGHYRTGYSAGRGCHACVYTDKCNTNTVERDGLAEQVGRKDDTVKPRWSLLPEGVVMQIVEVLDFGATKYTEGNWKYVAGGRQRYYDALMRHVDAWWGGEKLDPESGKHHLAHAGCCLMFLLWLDKRG